MPRFVNVIAAALALAGFSPHGGWAEERAQETAGDYGDLDAPFIRAAKEACDKGDVRGFWEAFVGAEAVQARYKMNHVLKYTSKKNKNGLVVMDLASEERISKADYDLFPIYMSDYMYRPFPEAVVSLNGDDLYVELQFDQAQNEDFVVTWTVVRYDGLSNGGDDLGTPYLLNGEPYDRHTFGNSSGELAFVMGEECWMLAEDRRFVRD